MPETIAHDSSAGPRGKDRARRERGGGALPGLLATLAAAVAFLGALSSGFVWDDILLVEQNARIRHLENIPGFFRTDYVGGDYATGIYRPVTLTAYTLEYALFGNAPRGYHATGLALHALNTLLLFLIARRLRLPPYAAFFAATLFAVHPVQSETVIGIAGQSGLLATAFGLASWLCAMRARGWVASLPLLLLAMLSKENGVVWIVPIAITWGRGFVVRNVATIATLGVYLALRGAALGSVGVPAGGQILAGADIATRFVTMMRAFAHVARLLFWPATLSGDYSPNAIPVSATWDGIALAGLATFVAGLAIWAIVLRTPSPARGRAAALGMTLFFVGLAPVSNLVFPIGAVLAERFLYLPFAGLTLALGALFAFGVRRFAQGPPHAAGDSGLTQRAVTGALLLTIAIALPLAVRSHVRTADWRDHETFMESLIRDMPASYRAQEALAERRLREDDYRGALAAARTAREIYPIDRSLRLLEGRILLEAGDFRGAGRLFEQMVREIPNDRRARLLLADALLGMRRYEPALENYRTAALLFEEDHRAWIGVGRVCEHLRRRADAIAAYERALAIRPDLDEVAMRLGTIAFESGERERAVEYLSRIRDGEHAEQARAMLSQLRVRR